MAIMIGVVSQKGGVGKSTLCRLIAREYAANGWEVKIADLDVGQGTSYDWQSRRLKSGVNPEIPVERFGSVGQALKHADGYDLMVFDGKPYANAQTLEIAKACNLLILPTGLSLDDMRPSVLLANELCQKGIPKENFAFAFCRVGDSKAELSESHGYLVDAGYSVFDRALPEKTAYRRASDTGHTPTETRFPTLNQKADELAQSIIDKITHVAKD
jgi:chromosome partitioning protein